MSDWPHALGAKLDRRGRAPIPGQPGGAVKPLRAPGPGRGQTRRRQKSVAAGFGGLQARRRQFKTVRSQAWEKDSARNRLLLPVGDNWKNMTIDEKAVSFAAL